MNLTFRQIEAFQTVIATGSVTGAAEVLGVSQSAVSRRLSEFESQVGFTLFHREGRGLRPTPEARLLVDTVRRAFGGLDRIRETAEAIRDFRQSRLMLVTTSSFAARLLPDLVAAFARRRPAAAISLDVQSTDDAVEWLAAEACDFGFACDLSDSPRLCRRALFRGEAVCLVPDDHALARRDHVTAGDLDGESLVSYRADARFRHRVDAMLVAARVTPQTRYEARTTAAMVRLVENGLGIAVLGTARAEDFHADGCRILPFRPAIPYTLQMVWSSQRELTAVAADFAAMVDELYGPLASTDGARAAPQAGSAAAR